MSRLIESVVHKDGHRAKPPTGEEKAGSMSTIFQDHCTIVSTVFHLYDNDMTWGAGSRSALATDTVKGDRPLWSASTSPSTATKQRSAP